MMGECTKWVSNGETSLFDSEDIKKTCDNCAYGKDADTIGCPADWDNKSIICE